jgi:hypothetical protein
MHEQRPNLDRRTLPLRGTPPQVAVVEVPIDDRLSTIDLARHIRL